MTDSRVLVIIPAFNEEDTITDTILRVYESAPYADVVVVNDGSEDMTGEQAQRVGADVIDMPFNLGIGGAVQTGYLYAQDNNYDIAVQVDADGQHNPQYIHRLIEPIVKDQSDVVIGSRYIKPTLYKSPPWRRLGMIFFARLVNLLTGKKLTDTTSGFRAVNRKVIGYFAKVYPSDYPEVDVLVRLHNNRYRVTEIPVEMSERKGGRSSITFLKSIYYMIKVSLTVVINYLRRRKYS